MPRDLQLPVLVNPRSYHVVYRGQPQEGFLVGLPRIAGPAASASDADFWAQIAYFGFRALQPTSNAEIWTPAAQCKDV